MQLLSEMSVDGIAEVVYVFVDVTILITSGCSHGSVLTRFSLTCKCDAGNDAMTRLYFSETI